MYWFEIDCLFYLVYEYVLSLIDSPELMDKLSGGDMDDDQVCNTVSNELGVTY